MLGNMINPYNYQNQYQQQNLYNNPYLNQQRQSNELLRVTGLEGAKAYQMAPNSTAALFDNNEDLMYIKVTDSAGFPTIRTFKFEELSEFDKKQDLNTDFVSKSEFETFKQEVADYVQQFIQKQSSKQSTKQNITTNGISEELGKSGGFSSTDVSN